MKQRRKISFFMLLVIGLGIGWMLKNVKVGLIVGIVIGQSTEFYTSQSYKPTQKLAESGKTGPPSPT